MDSLSITLPEVKRAAAACDRATEARRAAERSDTDKTIALLKVFEPLLGIKSEAELKALSLDQVRRIARRRIDSGAVKLRGITLECLMGCIELAAARRNVSWREVFLMELGEARVQEVLSKTDETFSYKIVLP